MKYISNDKLKEYITGAVCFKVADDGYLHPNEIGFLFYGDSLEKWINNK